MQATAIANLKLQVLATVILATFCGAAFLEAQPRVTVPLHRDDVLDPPNYPYYVGEPFKVNVDYGKLLTRKQRASLQARIFRGTVEELMQHGGVSTFDGCRAYMTTVLKPYDYNGGLDFGLNFDDHWLGRNSGGKLGPGRFVLVFELSGPRSRVLILKDDESVPAYFSKGWSFVVRSRGERLRSRGEVEESYEVDVLQDMRQRTTEATAVLQDTAGGAAGTASGEGAEQNASDRCYRVTGGSTIAERFALLAAVSCEQVLTR